MDILKIHPLETMEHHNHCIICVKSDCTEDAKNPEICKMVLCENKCSMRMHACKLFDHKQVCKFQEVPCINNKYGCPRILRRCDIGKHLAHCPASVVACTVEWGRCPIYSTEKRKSVPFKEVNPPFGENQLDVALAMRDQRLLLKGLKAPASQIKVLKTNLTGKFPTLPLLSKIGCFREFPNTEDDIFKPADGSDACSDDGNAKKDEESEFLELRNKLENLLRPSKITHKHEEKPNNDTATPPKLQGIDEIPEAPPCPALHFNSALDICALGYSRYQSKPNDVYTFMCGEPFRRDEFFHHYKNVHLDIFGGLNGWMQRRCPMARSGCAQVVQRLRPALQGQKIILDEYLGAFGIQAEVPDVLLTQKVVEEEQALPEYQHCSNKPVDTRKNLIRQLSTCSVSSISSDNFETDVFLCSDAFSQLPIEILTKMTEYLDPFSLNNLALVSRKLRMIAGSVVKQRGIVLIPWRRIKHNGKVSWKEEDKSLRWMFSVAFTPIPHWDFTDTMQIGEHLSQCPFNRGVKKTQPTLLPGIHPINYKTDPETNRILKRMYPEMAVLEDATPLACEATA